MNGRGVGLWLALWLAGFTPPVAVQAQVMEIGDDGAVTTYDGPTVFTAQGAAPVGVKASPRPYSRRPLSRDLDDAARSAQLSAALVDAVAWRESGRRPGLVSRAGAVGEMQLMPRTAKALGVDPRVTRQNYAGGAAYLRALMQRYDGDLIKALAAYDAGPTVVDRYGGPPPFKETQAYVSAILERLSQTALDTSDAGSVR